MFLQRIQTNFVYRLASKLRTARLLQDKIEAEKVPHFEDHVPSHVIRPKEMRTLSPSGCHFFWHTFVVKITSQLLHQRILRIMSCGMVIFSVWYSSGNHNSFHDCIHFSPNV